MKKKREFEATIDEMPEEEFDICNAISSTECTGLMPTPPQNEAELDSYRAIYNFEPPKPETRDSGNEIIP